MTSERDDPHQQRGDADAPSGGRRTQGSGATDSRVVQIGCAHPSRPSATAGRRRARLYPCGQPVRPARGSPNTVALWPHEKPGLLEQSTKPFAMTAQPTTPAAQRVTRGVARSDAMGLRGRNSTRPDPFMSTHRICCSLSLVSCRVDRKMNSRGVCPHWTPLRPISLA